MGGLSLIKVLLIGAFSVGAANAQTTTVVTTTITRPVTIATSTSYVTVGGTECSPSSPTAPYNHSSVAVSTSRVSNFTTSTFALTSSIFTYPTPVSSLKFSSTINATTSPPTSGIPSSVVPPFTNATTSSSAISSGVFSSAIVSNSSSSVEYSTPISTVLSSSTAEASSASYSVFKPSSTSVGLYPNSSTFMTSTTSSSSASATCTPPHLRNGGFEDGVVSPWEQVPGVDNSVKPLVVGDSRDTGISVYGERYLETFLYDSEISLIHQNVTVCPRTRYKLSVSGQVAIDPYADPDKQVQVPACSIMICEDVSGICSESEEVNTSDLTTVTKRFRTSTGQKTADVFVYSACVGTNSTHVNSVYLDQIKIEGIIY